MRPMSTSKSAKKNARKREKKRLETMLKGKEETIPLKDPMTLLKEQLADAKANGDHKLAAKLRQDLWVLQDVNSGLNPSLDDEEVTESLQRVTIKATETCNKSTEVESSGSSFDKDLRKLKKKLDQIENLKKKQKSGEKLEESQIIKINSEQTILKEIKDIEEIIQSVKLKR
ncbi:uncharacterized protein LOC130641341 isoform X2 [Hydractinia symbiolongicarpus]|uniref:uncharacterized protein LOC130641341 isoform X2 n=1 Tax=Hydractinia symbiolongicarpus TaxID=13093 RepID=UPI00254A24FB|nr:uncharacterized protein LOC130641341 isoform X2 [Hydractinia symbiolongicarpus]